MASTLCLDLVLSNAPSVVKNGFEKLIFLSDSSKFFYILDHEIWFQFRQHIVQIRIK